MMKRFWICILIAFMLLPMIASCDANDLNAHRSDPDKESSDSKESDSRTESSDNGKEDSGENKDSENKDSENKDSENKNTDSNVDQNEDTKGEEIKDEDNNTDTGNDKHNISNNGGNDTSNTPNEGDETEEIKCLNLKWTALGYYNTQNSYRPMQIISDASNSASYYASKRFTREELPVGSVIVLADGWKYRPEAWPLENTERPAEVFDSRVVVTEEWWGDYTYRAFNLSKVGNPSLEDVSQKEIDEAFIIYLPEEVEDGNTGNADTSSWDSDGVLKILMIGNSFSQDTMQYMSYIAKSAGVSNVKLCNLYIGGCSLGIHADNAKNDKAAYQYENYSTGTCMYIKNYKMSDALKSEDWDFISIQQASGHSGNADTYNEDLEYLIGYVKGLVPNAKLVWNMTWAYQQDSNHGDFLKYNRDQMTMYNSIISAVQNKIATNNNICIIVPNGTAVQNARTSYVGDKLTRDGYHLSLDFGRYIAGLTFFHAVTGVSIKDIIYMPAGVDDNLQKIAIESAMDAISNPYDVIKSSYVTFPLFDESKYERADPCWTALGYYNSDNGTKNIVTNADNSKFFYASKLFTKAELPVGSILMLADGWKYRPEAWERGGTARPSEVSLGYMVITDTWWGNYTHRAFNLSKVGNPSLEGVTQGEVDNAFIIYVPKA